MERYINKNGKKLRYGYTTGSCATAATKACALALCEGIVSEKVSISTPKGWDIEIDVYDLKVEGNSSSCYVIKDGGDDPDMTNGMRVFSKVTLRDDELINITGGTGVGVVTKPGLSVDIGKSAINPTPLRTIEDEVKKVLGDRGANVVISAPEGVEIAKRTFNPKLGIEGGISIIGTSGIVEPMSEDAIIETMKIELSVFKETYGERLLLLSPGNYGRDFCVENGMDISGLVKTSNYIGEVIDEALRLGVKRVLWVGHSGKMIKVAGGNFNTHSKISDSRMEIIAAYLGVMGAEKDFISKVLLANTTDEAVDMIMESPYMNVFDVIADKVSAKCKGRAFGEIEFGTVLFTNKHGMIGICEAGKKFSEELKI